MIRLPTLYARDAKGKIIQWTIWTDGGLVYTEHGLVSGEKQESHYECEPKNVGRVNETTAPQQADKEAQAKWDKQRKKKYFLSPEEALGAENTRPMLALKFEDHKHKLQYPVIVQPKLDGVRCMAFKENGTVVLRSRGNEVFDIKHISDALAPFTTEGMILDGEVYVHGRSLQQITSLVKRPQEASKELQYWVYDMPGPHGNESRDALKTGLFGDLYIPGGLCPDVVVNVVSDVAVDELEVKQHHDLYVSQGFEGAIVRSRTGLYRFGHRSADLLKVKVFDDGEFEILGWKMGKGAFENVPIVECKAPGGTFDVAPRGSMEVRAELAARLPALIGAKMTVRHFGWTDDKLPRFPVGICVREID